MHFLNCVLSFVLVSCEMLLLVLFLRFVGGFLYSVGFLYDFFFVLANAYLKKKKKKLCFCSSRPPYYKGF